MRRIAAVLLLVGCGKPANNTVDVAPLPSSSTTPDGAVDGDTDGQDDRCAIGLSGGAAATGDRHAVRAGPAQRAVRISDERKMFRAPRELHGASLHGSAAARGGVRRLRESARGDRVRRRSRLPRHQRRRLRRRDGLHAAHADVHREIVRAQDPRRDRLQRPSPPLASSDVHSAGRLEIGEVPSRPRGALRLVAEAVQDDAHALAHLGQIRAAESASADPRGTRTARSSRSRTARASSRCGNRRGRPRTWSPRYA